MAPRGIRKKELLRAAELVFAERGYHGATMREITTAARVPLGLSNYYFGSKEKLFEAVLEERQPQLVSLQDDALTELLARNPEPGVEEVIEAYVSAHMSLVRTDEGWRNHFRILYQVAGSDDRDRLGALLFPPHGAVAKRYVAVLSRALPAIEIEAIRRALILVRMLRVSFITESLTGRAHPDIDRLSLDTTPELVRFCAAGFLASVGAEARARETAKS